MVWGRAGNTQRDYSHLLGKGLFTNGFLALLFTERYVAGRSPALADRWAENSRTRYDAGIFITSIKPAPNTGVVTGHVVHDAASRGTRCPVRVKAAASA